MSIESVGGGETVWWINRFPERGTRKILEKFHIVPSIEVPALTTIPIDRIDELDDEELRESLKRQLEGVRQDEPSIEVPVVHMSKEQLSHSWSVATQSAREHLDSRIHAWRDAAG